MFEQTAVETSPPGPGPDAAVPARPLDTARTADGVSGADGSEPRLSLGADAAAVTGLDVSGLGVRAVLEAAAGLREASLAAETKLLELAARYADLYAEPDPGVQGEPGVQDEPRRPGRERAVTRGGDGCPSMAEFASVEFGLMLGVAPGTAARFIGDALALRHRFPACWARVRGGAVPAWRARRVVTACQRLCLQAAGLVDERVAPLLERLTDYRLDKIVAAAVAEADPDLALARAEEAERRRGVWLSRGDEHGTRSVVMRMAAVDACRFYAAADALADRLAWVTGDRGDKDWLRAQAAGWLANPAAALAPDRDHPGRVRPARRRPRRRAGASRRSARRPARRPVQRPVR